MRCLACDFGGSSVKYALVDHAAILTEAGEVEAPLQTKEAFTETVAKLYERFGNRVDGIAISLPGLIDAETGLHHGSGAYAPILSGQNIIRLLQARCPTRITVENDGKCGALAEAWNGSHGDWRRRGPERRRSARLLLFRRGVFLCRDRRGYLQYAERGLDERRCHRADL